jgi:hypothetical protein
MKKNIGRFVVTCASAMIVQIMAVITPAYAALEDFDPFNYSTTALSGQSGGTGWNGAWFTTASTDNALSDDGVSLAYPASFQSPLTTPSSTGSHVLTGGINASTSRLLAQTIPLNVDGTTRYVSALLRKNAANGGGVNNDNVLLEFVDSSANRRWGIGIEGTGDKPWLNANGSTTPSAGPTVTPGDTYFIVAKIVSSAAGSDQAFLKVFGTGYSSQVPAAEPTTWDATLSETTGAILDRVRVRIDLGNTATAPGEVDDIRIATTWTEVVGGQLPAGQLGDFNNDGKVDAADYVIWRKDPANNGGDPGGYDTWRANFGNPPGSGAGLFAASVPEPAGFFLLQLGVAALVVARRHQVVPFRRYVLIARG